MSKRNNSERRGVEEIENLETEKKEVQNYSSECSVDDFFLPAAPVAVPLPTKGRFYPEGHPLKGKEFVEIRSITTKDEEILASDTYVKQGISMDRMLDGLFIDRRVRTEDMFNVDKNSVLMRARIESYGSTYSAKIICPECGNASAQKIDLEQFHLKDTPEDVLFDSDGQFPIRFKWNGPKGEIDVEVRVRLLSGKDEKRLFQSNKKKEKHKMHKTPLQDLYKTLIVSVNGNDDPMFLEKFVSQMHTKMANKIYMEYSRIVPNIDTTIEFYCDDGGCNAKSDINVPLGANFFRHDHSEIS